MALKSRPRLLECLDCGRQTLLTAGTAMHRSKLPLTTWFWAAHVMATHSNGMSARQLEDQLGVTYKTAWLLAQKTSALDGRCPTAIFSKASSRWTRRRFPFAPATRLRARRRRQILVAGAVEVIDRSAGRPSRDAGANIDTRSGPPPARDRRQLLQIDQAFVRARVKPGATLITDGHAAYPGLSGDCRHDPRVALGTWRQHRLAGRHHRGDADAENVIFIAAESDGLERGTAAEVTLSRSSPKLDLQ